MWTCRTLRGAQRATGGQQLGGGDWKDAACICLPAPVLAAWPAHRHAPLLAVGMTLPTCATRRRTTFFAACWPAGELGALLLSRTIRTIQGCCASTSSHLAAHWPMPSAINYPCAPPPCRSVNDMTEAERRERQAAIQATMLGGSGGGGVSRADFLYALERSNPSCRWGG